MKLIGSSNSRQIHYTSVLTDSNWLDNLPTENWLVFPIGQDKEIETYSLFADKCIDNNVLYVCAVGQNCELIQDIFDELIVSKKIEKCESVDSSDDFENSPITTWHNNFSEGFWFAILYAHHEQANINKIVCVEFTTKGVKQHLTNLIEKINTSWLPSDEENEVPLYDNNTRETNSSS